MNEVRLFVNPGKTRYHLAECRHAIPRYEWRWALGRTVRDLEALVEVGIFPCGHCRPLDHMVKLAQDADARRVRQRDDLLTAARKEI